ncbi:MAG: hypothetical protein ACXW3M_08120 [Rhodoplanes sp.]
MMQQRIADLPIFVLDCCESRSQKQAQLKVRAAAKRLPKLAIQPRHITGTTAGHGPVFRGAYIDAATRPAPVYAAAYVAPAARSLSALFSAFCFSLCAICWHAVTLPPMVITQQAAQSLAALNMPVAAGVCTPREQQDIALPLVIPFGMEMFDIFAQRSPQRALAKEDHLAQALLLHRPVTQRSA